MNKKKYGLLVGVMGVIIILLVVVLFVLIKQKSNDSDINKKIAESVVPDDLVGEWTGGWIEKGGVVGAALGFAIGGVMIFFVGLTYAELTAAMPQCGGEHVFSHRAMGPVGSFVCTWAIILGYVGVTCF